MRDMDEVLTTVCSFLNKEKIDYVLVGGLAVIFYGIPRTTMDIDIILRIEAAKMPRLVEFLKRNDFFASAEDIETAFKEKSHCTVQDKKSMIRLDIKGIYNEMDQRTFNGRRSFVHKGTKIYLASPEDTIANKLVFGSEQDVRDAEGIYVRQMGKLDVNHLSEICGRMGVSKELKNLKRGVERLLKEDG